MSIKINNNTNFTVQVAISNWEFGTTGFSSIEADDTDKFEKPDLEKYPSLLIVKGSHKTTVGFLVHDNSTIRIDEQEGKITAIVDDTTLINILINDIRHVGYVA